MESFSIAVDAVYTSGKACDWGQMKKSLFTVLMLLEGLTHRINSTKFGTLDELRAFSLRTLKILQSLHFITFRFNYSTFQVWTYVHLSAVDIYTATGASTFELYNVLKPSSQPSLEAYQIHTLFLLDTLELIAAQLPSELTEQIKHFVMPYLLPLPPSFSTDNSKLARGLLDSSHSLLLSLIGTMHNAEEVLRLSRAVFPILLNVTIFTLFGCELTL